MKATVTATKSPNVKSLVLGVLLHPVIFDLVLWLVKLTVGCVASVVVGAVLLLLHIAHRLVALTREHFTGARWKTLNGEVVVITGGRGGFGAVVSKELQSVGAHVFSLDITPVATAGPSVTASGGRVVEVQCDITSEAEVAAFIETHIRPLGKPVYALVNNAGIFGKPCAVIECSDANMRKVMDVNFFAALNLTRALYPFMIKKDSGDRREKGHPTRSRVVNVTSCAGLVTFPGMAAYTCAKFALEAQSDSLRMEMADELDVCIVEPHFAATGIFTPLFNASEADLRASRLATQYLNSREKFKRQQASRRGGMMTAEFVGDAIVRAVAEKVVPDRVMVTPNMFLEGITRLCAHAPNYFLWQDALKRTAAEEK